MSDKPAKSAWAHKPDLPVQFTPLFDWPPRPGAVLKWFSKYYFAVSTSILYLVLSVAIYLWVLPPVEAMATLSFSWIGIIWAKNFFGLLIWGGALHLYLWHLRRQGNALKFDHREVGRSRLYTFGNQLYDNMFWTLGSGALFATIYESLWFWAAANGLVPLTGPQESPVWFVLWIVLIPIWSSFHFYWVHRLLHWPPLYRIGHALHHRNINTLPFTGISMHPVEHVIYFSSYAIHFVVASHPIHMQWHFGIQCLGPLASHSGFEGIADRDGKKQVGLGDFFHQLHHRYFECNYGTIEMPWDRWFGTFHNGTEGATEGFRARMRKMHAR